MFFRSSACCCSFRSVGAKLLQRTRVLADTSAGTSHSEGGREWLV